MNKRMRGEAHVIGPCQAPIPKFNNCLRWLAYTTWKQMILWGRSLWFLFPLLDKLNYISAEYLNPYLSYIREHKTIFSTALVHSNTFGFENIFQRMFDNIFDPILERFHYPTGDRKYVMLFYLNGINAIVIQWLKDGCDKSNEDIYRIINECIFGLKTK